jgi:acetyl-CoA acetyltransferase
MDNFPRGRTAIVGAATYGVGEAPGMKPNDMAALAGLDALRQAGIKLSDVDGLFVCTSNDALSGLGVAEYLGIRPGFSDNNRTGGSAFMSHVVSAALALDAGYCDVALVLHGSNQRTGAGGLVSMRQASPYETPYRPLNPLSSYALAASRHMHQYGTTREQLAEVAVAARGWANMNPEAFARGPLSIEDVLKSRMVSSPLTARDCCLITDGAAAVVMVRADRAKDFGMEPVYVLGGAAEVWHSDIASMPDLTVTAASESGRRAYAMAGVGPADIDVVQLYDAFTINTILFLEDLGFCPKGEGGWFVSGGAIGPGGVLPVNTNGGGLSYAHPGMYGLLAIVEAVRQLRGESAERQVKGAELALAHGNGGTLSSQATLILGTGATL